MASLQEDGAGGGGNGKKGMRVYIQATAGESKRQQELSEKGNPLGKCHRS